MLAFHADGSVEVTLNNGTKLTLRRPTIGEWGQIYGAYRDAEADMKAAGADPADRAEMLWGHERSGYAEAFALVCDLLSDAAALSPGDLPMWAGTEAVFPRLYAHWRNPPIEYVDLLDPFKPADEQPAVTAPASPLSQRPAADADIQPLDIDALRDVPPGATAPPAGAPATGYISQRAQQGV